jgi:hypothetical protein
LQIATSWCNTVKDIANIAAPNENGLVGFKGSSIFIAAPGLCKTILTSGTNNLFKLIPIVNESAKTFDLEHEKNKTMTIKAITHADNLSTWLYGMKVGSIKETRYQVVPDNLEIAAFCK